MKPFIVMKVRTKRVLRFAAVIGAAAVAAVLLYAVLFGPLFAFSPVKFGFNELSLARCSVFYPLGTTPDPAYAKLDDLIGEVEKFHRLSFSRRVRVMVCASDSQYGRFSRAGGSASTMPTGTVICVRPSIAATTYPPSLDHRDGRLKLLPPSNPANRDLQSFLKHELSHAILYQNTTLWKAAKIKRWVEEGLAIYSGNSAHYYGGKDLQTLAIGDKFWFDLLDEDAEPVGIPADIKHYFSYGLYGSFVAFLIETYGDEKVLTFIHDYIHAPADEEKLFLTTFGISLPDAVERYRQDLSKPGAA